MSRVPKIELIEEMKGIDIEAPKGRGEQPPTPKTKNSIDNEWSIGCLGKLDRRCVVYFSQISILGLCIGVSLYQVSTRDDNKDFWIGLLSSSIGILIPNPKLSKKD
jgi:hypothetical protein